MDQAGISCTRLLLSEGHVAFVTSMKKRLFRPAGRRSQAMDRLSTGDFARKGAVRPASGENMQVFKHDLFKEYEKSKELLSI